MCAVAVLSSHLLYSAPAHRYASVEVYVAAVDLALLLGIVVIMALADRFWPIALFAIHGVTVLAHVVKVVQMQVRAALERLRDAAHGHEQRAGEDVLLDPVDAVAQRGVAAVGAGDDLERQEAVRGEEPFALGEERLEVAVADRLEHRGPVYLLHPNYDAASDSDTMEARASRYVPELLALQPEPHMIATSAARAAYPAQAGRTAPAWWCRG